MADIEHAAGIFALVAASLRIGKHEAVILGGERLQVEGARDQHDRLAGDAARHVVARRRAVDRVEQAVALRLLRLGAGCRAYCDRSSLIHGSAPATNVPSSASAMVPRYLSGELIEICTRLQRVPLPPGAIAAQADDERSPSVSRPNRRLAASPAFLPSSALKPYSATMLSSGRSPLTETVKSSTCRKRSASGLTR